MKEKGQTHQWQLVYEQKKFEITTQNPSKIVEIHKDKFDDGDNVLDIGCGNGRNSIFLASIGCNVDSFDVANLGWTNQLPEKLKEKINFSQTKIDDFKYEENKYKAIVITRVIQYLNKKELIGLLDNVYKSLTENGFLLLNFNSQGGIFDKKEIDVPKYQYPIEEIQCLLEEKFKKIMIYQGSEISQYVNYEEKIKSYDIFTTDKF